MSFFYSTNISKITKCMLSKYFVFSAILVFNLGGNRVFVKFMDFKMIHLLNIDYDLILINFA